VGANAGGASNFDYSYLENSTTVTSIIGQNPNASAFFSADVIAKQFNAFSDIRIKTNIMTDFDSDKIRNIDVVKYEYIDKVLHSSKPKYGFIAQNIEQVFPHIVSKCTEFVPNIYSFASVNQKTLLMESMHDLKENDCIRVAFDSKYKDVYVTKVIDDNKIEIDTFLGTAVDKVFIIGKQVDDFRTVDHDQILALLLKEFQQLKTDMEIIKSKINL
jgi:hypothetical protein